MVVLTRAADEASCSVHMTRCSLSVTDLGAPANTVLQKSTRVVTKAWTIVFMDSSSKVTPCKKTCCLWQLFFQWQLRLPSASGISPPLSWSKKLVDASLQSRRTQERRCSCSSAYFMLFKGDAVAFPATFDAVWYHVVVVVFAQSNFRACGFVQTSNQRLKHWNWPCETDRLLHAVEG